VITRRRFLSLAAGAGAALTLPDVAWAQRFLSPKDLPLRLGFLAAPRVDPAQLAAALGAALAVEEARRAAELLNRQVFLASATATTGDLPRVMRELSERGVVAVVGNGDGAWSEAAGRAAEARRMLLINIGCCDDRLRSSCHQSTFHVQASSAMYFDALTDGLIQAGSKRWLMVTAGAEMSDRAGHAMEKRGGILVGTVPAGSVSREQLIQRIKESSPDVVCMVMPDGGASLLDRWPDQGPYQIACLPTGTLHQPTAAALRSPVPTVWPVLWHSGLTRYGAEQLNQRYERHFKQPLTPAAWAGWFAMKALWETSLKVDSPTAATMIKWLDGDTARFDGHKGVPLTFRGWDHQLRQPLYVVRVDATGITPLAEEPGGQATDSQGNPLDQLGDTEARTPCRIG
jgi:ABC-type branched-subunit amino acid transport system substrate-binding protein